MKVSCPHCSQHIALIALLSLCDPLAQAQELSAPPAASASAQMEAVKKYPPLGVAGSAFNREFLARTQRARAETPGLFDDPAWPLALADEVARDLPPVAEPDFGPQVLAFCRSNLDRKVGNGECSTLATQALASAKAAGMGKDAPGVGDYVWGKQMALIEAGRKGVAGLENLALLKPGDIVQFRNVRLEGSSHNGGKGRYWMAGAHHTAVVAEVDEGQAALKVIHQNWGAKVVRQDVMYLGDLVKGWMRIYRPQSDPR